MFLLDFHCIYTFVKNAGFLIIRNLAVLLMQKEIQLMKLPKSPFFKTFQLKRLNNWLFKISDKDVNDNIAYMDY